MAGLKDPEAEKATRWAKAHRYAQGYADNGMSRALTIYYTRYFPLITLAAFGCAVAIAFLRAGEGPVDGWFIGWLGTYLFAITTALGGITYNIKRLKPTVELGSTLSIVMPLEKEEQRALTRAINGKQLIPDEHLTIARALAVQYRKTLATWLIVGPAYTYILGPAFSSPTSFNWVYLMFLVPMIIALVLGIRSFRRQGRFLTTTAHRSHTAPS